MGINKKSMGIFDVLLKLKKAANTSQCQQWYLQMVCEERAQKTSL